MRSGLYSIPLGRPFLPNLAYFLKTFSPEDLKRAWVLLPTHASCQSLKTLLYPATLPKILVMGDEEPLSDESFSLLWRLSPKAGSIPPFPLTLSSLASRQVWMQRLERALQPSSQKSLKESSQESFSFWMDLADSLGPFLDILAEEGKSLEELSFLSSQKEVSDHWIQRGQLVTTLARQKKEEGTSSFFERESQRQYALYKALLDQWTQSPPTVPIFMVGSRGSTSLTRQFMTLIPTFSKGFVVLPGDDQDHVLNQAEKESSHPFHTMAQFLRSSSSLSSSLGEPRKEEKRVLMALESLQLPPHRAAGLSSLEELKSLWEDVAWVEAKDPQEEALVISLALKEVWEKPDGTGALITADLSLLRRVSLLLTHEKIPFKNRPISLLYDPLGSLGLLILSLAFPHTRASEWMAALRHPCFYYPDSEGWSLWLSHLEIQLLRPLQPHMPFWKLASWTPFIQNDFLKGPFFDFFQKLCSLVASLSAAFKTQSLSSLVEAHKALLLFVTSCDGWQEDSGQAIISLWEDLCATTLPLKTLHDYEFLLKHLFSSIFIKPAEEKEKRIFLLTPSEARLLSFNKVILGGLNEGSWPREKLSTPWLTPDVRQGLCLQFLGKEEGLEALEFLQGLSASQVLMTRSQRAQGAPTLPSRWLIHLRAYLMGYLISFQKSSLEEDFKNLWAPTPWLEEVRQRRLISVYCPTTQPAPCPPVETRPRHLSVTRVETWRRNPYGIYAEFILKLVPLSPLDRGLHPSDRGVFIHKALEMFFLTSHGLTLLREAPSKALELLLSIGQDLAEHLPDQLIVQTVWWPRFQQMAAWFVEVQQGLLSDVDKIIGEVSGQISWEAPGGLFTLTAEADRIDVLKTGELRLIDYKTNQAPSQKDIGQGYSPQVTLEGWMAQEGAFPIQGPVKELAYWILKGGQKGGVILSVDPPGKTLSELMEEAEKGLKNLVALFDSPTTPYLCYPFPDKAPYFDPYSHLARVKEWLLS